jgi:hypothetical protein
VTTNLAVCLPPELNPNISPFPPDPGRLDELAVGHCEFDDGFRPEPCENDRHCEDLEFGSCILPGPQGLCAKNLAVACAQDDDCIVAERPCLPAPLVDDCQNRVQPTVNGMASSCGYDLGCTCVPVPSMVDSDDNPVYTFSTGRTCIPGGGVDDNPDPDDPICAEEPLLVDDQTLECLNFDPVGFTECMADCPAVDFFCADECLALVSATNAPGDVPVCLAEDLGEPLSPAPASGASATAAGLDSPGFARPLGFGLFGRRSTCDVEGTAEILVKDKNKNPPVRGTVEFVGEPCPGGGCSVGLVYRLAMDPIKFSNFWGSRTFRELEATGNSPVHVAQLSGVDGVFPPGTASGVGRGSRNDQTLALAAVNRNPLDVSVDWDGRECSLNGNLISNVGVDTEFLEGVCAGDDSIECQEDSECGEENGPCEIEEDSTDPMSVDLADVGGPLVNQPPTAVAGEDQSVECTSVTGAEFTLDGDASSDADENLRLVSWRAGSRAGPEVGSETEIALALGVGESESYVLRVMDAFAQTDEDSTSVEVVDRTAPVIESLVATPDRLWPPDHRLQPIELSIEVSDVCDASPTCVVTEVESDEEQLGEGSGHTANDWVISGGLGLSLRAERQGKADGRVYTVTVECSDATGNTETATVKVNAPHNSACGLGFELALLLPLLTRLHGRRRPRQGRS